MRLLQALVAGCVLAVASVHALAQDYTVVNPATLETTDPDYADVRFRDPPANATTYASLNGGLDNVDKVTMPFEFIYFGTAFTTMWFHTNGHCQFTSGTPTYSQYTNTGFPPNGTDTNSYDGMVAPLWDDLYPGASKTASLTTHTEGTAPNRVFVLSWNNVPAYGNTAASYKFQVQLFEATSQIAFTYTTTGATWSSMHYSWGIRAPNSVQDKRFVTPGGSIYTSVPANNWLFTPVKTPVSGRVVFDRIVNSENGIGTSVQADVPASGTQVEFVRADGKTVVGRTFAKNDGTFTVSGLALPAGAETGTLRIVSGSAAASVRTSPTAPLVAITIASGVEYGKASNLGDVVIDEATDPGAAFRQSYNVARVCSLVRGYVQDTLGVSIPSLEALFTPGLGQGTRYSPATDTTAASLRVASNDAPNPDGWDDDVIAAAYGHHAIEYVTGVRSTGHTPGLDVVSNGANAFVQGFGTAMWAALNGNTKAIDATSSSSAIVVDLNTPTALGNARSPAVAGWVAAAIFDLMDGGDESTEKHDTIDGRTVESRTLIALGRLTETPLAAPYVNAWRDAGYDLNGITRNFIHHGLLPDDANEPNDSAAEAAHLGTIGLLRGPFVLNQANEDWYTFDVAVTQPSVTVDVSFNRFAFPATITVQILNSLSNVVATGVAQGTIGPYRSVPTNVAPGRYFVRIRHDSGPVVPSYQVQASAPLRFVQALLPDWTVGFPYAQTFQVTGGIPPYALTVDAPSTPPTGLILDSKNLRVSGSPATAGRYQFLVTLRDSGSPVNEASSAQDMRINAPLSFEIEDVLGFALDRPSDLQIERTGGTQPISVSTGDDVLPAGLTFTSDLRLTGTATEAGGLPLHIEATDLAGSQAEADTTLVVCAPYAGKNTAVPLIPGGAAAGYYIDGVAGTTFSLKVKTAKKQEKRDLQAILLGPDGRRIQSGVISAKSGSASFKNVVLPVTGRFFAIITSPDGGASELVAVLKTKLLKKDKNTVEEFGAGDTEQIRFGALAGTEFTFQAKPRDGLIVQPQFLEAPDGTVYVQAILGAVEGKKGSFTLKRTLDQSGTWQLNITRKSGPAGRLDYKMKLRQPKNGTFKVD